MPVPPAPAGSEAGAPALQLERRFEARLDTVPHAQGDARRSAAPADAGGPETGVVASPETRRAARTRPSVPHLAGPQPAVPHAPWDIDAASGDSAAHIEDQLARLAGARGLLRRLLAAIADRLIASKAPDRLCYARLGDYARERLGLTARQLQELARVHRAFARLPRLERALASNELPWSKVRLIARVATEEDEEAWIALAREIPTRRLEHAVRESAGSGEPQDADELASEKRVTVRCSPAVREKWSLAREMAERVAGQRLRAGEALEFVAAEVFSAVSIDPAFAEVPEEPSASIRGDRAGLPEERRVAEPRAHSPGLPGSIASLATGLDEADAFELDRRLRLALRLEQTLDAAMAPLLRVVSSPEYEWRGDYCPLSTYAREQLGMSASKARALLRLERASDVCPELRDAYRSGRVSWVKAHCLLPLLLLDIEGEWRPIWVAWAERVTVRRLEEDVERALLLRAGHGRAFERCLFDPVRAQDPIPSDERQMCAHDVDVEATQRLEWRVPCEVAALFRAVCETVRSRLRGEEGRFPSDGEVLDAMLECALLAWTVRDPRAHRPDPVIERDGYRCAVPGCTSRRNLHDHHLRFRSAGGSDEPGNRVALCAFHHQRCLHVGFMRIRGRAPDGLIFELGLRPGAGALVRYRSGDIALPERELREPASQRRAA